MRRRLFILITVLALLAAACSSQGGSDATESLAYEGDSPAATEAPAEAQAPARDDSTGNDGESEGKALLGDGGVDAAVVVDLGRDIIFEAWVTVAVEDVGAAGVEAVSTVEQFGGFVFGQETTGAPNPRTTLTFKVDPDRFRDVLAALGDIGELRSQVITADDVTERVVDLESRITTVETSVERLRDLLSKATDMKTIAEIETQLLDRETQLETLRGQLRTIEDRVSLATIVLTITETFADPGLDVTVSAYPDADATGASCPGDSYLEVEEGTTVTVCFEFVNTGDTLLGDFTLRDPVLDVELADLTLVYGTLDRAIEPGESIMLVVTTDVDRTVQTRARVTAVPMNPDGEVLEGRAISQTVGISFRSLQRTELPGFLDGFEESLDLLVRIWEGVLLALGAVLPFAVVIGVIWGVIRLVRGPRSGKPKIAKVAEDVENETVAVDLDE